MKKRIELSEEDKQLFRQSVKGTRPLVHDKILLQPKMTHPVTVPETEVYIPSIQLPEYKEEPTIRGDEIIFFAHSGLQTKIIKRLKRGELHLQGKLDLHGLTSDQAQTALVHYLDICRSQNKRQILIVHGKGRNPLPILKNQLYYWLTQHPYVLALHSAQPQHGGTGAVYVILKSARK